jgi:hypothetical protein
MKMKKLKKIFSMALASVMALSMLTVPVSAEKGNVIDSIAVSKTINVNRNASIPQETFTFTMTAATQEQINASGDYAKVGNEAVKPGVDLATDKQTISYTFSSTDTSKVTAGSLTKTGEEFDLSGLSFDNAGIYRYYIQETPPETKEPYITYSTDKYMIDLYVYAESDGTYKPRDISVTKIVTTIVKTVEGEKEVETPQETYSYIKPAYIDFTNDINTRNLKISKTVVGEEYKSNEEFDFWIEIPVGGDTITLTENATLQANLCDASGYVVDENGNPITYTLTVRGHDGDKGATATVDTVKACNNHFKLKNGQYLEICAPTRQANPPL